MKKTCKAVRRIEAGDEGRVVFYRGKNTWNQAELPPEKDIMPQRAILKRKEDAQRRVAHYKAHLLTEGHLQKENADYY